MYKGVITYDHGNRFVDRVSRLFYRMRLFETDGYYPILDNKTGKEVGQFVCCYGNKMAIRLLEKITDYKHGTKVNIDY